MQTFLPLDDIQRSLVCLDYRRLGKQRVEAEQIRQALQPGYTKGWRNHPAVLMWKGHEPALVFYRNEAIKEWVGRGYRNTMPLLDIDHEVVMPWWFGNANFHAAHRSNLLRKDFSFYSQYNWEEGDSLPYWWPTHHVTTTKTTPTNGPYQHGNRPLLLVDNGKSTSIHPDI